MKQFSVRGGRGTAVDYERPTVLPLGRYYSTHLSTGRLASTLVWCQENYKTPSTKPGRCHESLNLLIKKHLKLYKKSKFSEHLSKTLNALMDSVDIATPEYRYLKLHTAIEIMVGSDKSETINKRLSFPPLSSHYNEKLILALRGSRNKLVHAGVSSEIANNDINVKIYLLTMLASHYIGFMLANHYGYQTLDGFLNFTSMRYDSKLVDRQMQDLKNLKAING
ncbi:hypothetical protein KF946_03325 [Idiomarina loihiensis]|uniref:hypothetical protein n=1 Tax=Idiomarina loihiensis TaxID=135577 RepID=UPI0021075E82|nr:hypothetical protein [Idiomarina loihiensis]UTW33617.1 hypothetical protein KF946_03325 [Idiomarina loihiensis]